MKKETEGPVHFIAMLSQLLHLDEPQTNSGPPQLEMEEACKEGMKGISRKEEGAAFQGQLPCLESS